jgi:hypothetical protein
MANETNQGDCAIKPSPKHLALPEAAIHVLELPETYTCVWWSRFALDRPVTVPATSLVSRVQIDEGALAR